MDFNFEDTSPGQFDPQNREEEAGLAQLRMFTQSFLRSMVYPTPLGSVPIQSFLEVAITTLVASGTTLPFGVLNVMANSVLDYALEQGFLTETGQAQNGCECGECGDTVEVSALGLAFVGPPSNADPNNN